MASYSLMPTQFQFHKGTIKPQARAKRLGVDGGFQFHKGTIKPKGITQQEIANKNFNSIKVRLNLSSSQQRPLRYVKFQFHKGTIKPKKKRKKKLTHNLISIP